MSNVKLNVLFKKIQKDDKKEVLEFHVQGDELPHSDQIVELAGSIVVLEVEKTNAGKINAEFKTVQRDSKKTTLKFNVKGDSDEQMNKLYPYAGRSVMLQLEASQMSIEEFNEPHEGVKVKVEQDGTASVVDADQMSMDDVNEPEELEEVEEEAEDMDPFDVNMEDEDELD